MLLYYEQGYVQQHCTHLRALRYSEDKVKNTWVKPLQQWIRTRGGLKDRLADYRYFVTSILVTLDSSRRHPLLKCVLWLLLLFNAFSAERLAREISLYQLLSNWLHRLWPYSNQESTALEANCLSNRSPPSYCSSLGT